MSTCPFCVRIKAGDFESFTDDPTVVWFEPLNPVTPGHMLFVPVRHVEDALADPYTTAITAEMASRWWSRKWGIKGGQRDCNLITSVGPLATQSVRHLHVHLLPRREGDGLALPWTGQRGRQDTNTALLSLAAWFDRNERETAAEVEAHRERDDDDAAIMADGARSAWRDAAREARLRAGAGSERESAAQPVSPDAGEAQGHSGQLSASERDLVRADLGQLLEALGLGDYARPQSPHEVMLQCIAEVGKIRSAEAERIAQLLDRKRAVFCRPCDGEVCDYSGELSPASELVRGGGDG